MKAAELLPSLFAELPTAGEAPTKDVRTGAGAFDALLAEAVDQDAAERGELASTGERESPAAQTQQGPLRAHPELAVREPRNVVPGEARSIHGAIARVVHERAAAPRPEGSAAILEGEQVTARGELAGDELGAVADADALEPADEERQLESVLGHVAAAIASIVAPLHEQDVAGAASGEVEPVAEVGLVAEAAQAAGGVTQRAELEPSAASSAERWRHEAGASAGAYARAAQASSGGASSERAAAGEPMAGVRAHTPPQEQASLSEDSRQVGAGKLAASGLVQPSLAASERHEAQPSAHAAAEGGVSAKLPARGAAQASETASLSTSTPVATRGRAPGELTAELPSQRGALAVPSQQVGMEGRVAVPSPASAAGTGRADLMSGAGAAQRQTPLRTPAEADAGELGRVRGAASSSDAAASAPRIPSRPFRGPQASSVESAQTKQLAPASDERSAAVAHGFELPAGAAPPLAPPPDAPVSGSAPAQATLLASEGSALGAAGAAAGQASVLPRAASAAGARRAAASAAGTIAPSAARPAANSVARSGSAERDAAATTSPAGPMQSHSAATVQGAAPVQAPSLATAATDRSSQQQLSPASPTGVPATAAPGMVDALQRSASVTVSFARDEQPTEEPPSAGRKRALDPMARIEGFTRGARFGVALSAYGGRGHGSAESDARGTESGERERDVVLDGGAALQLTPSFEQTPLQAPAPLADARPLDAPPRPAAAPAPMAAPVDLPEAEFSRLPTAQPQNASISLHHPDLGPIQIQVHRSEGKVQVSAIIESAHAQAVLRANESGIRMGVQQSGMTFGALRVKLRGDERERDREPTRPAQVRRRRVNERGL